QATALAASCARWGEGPLGREQIAVPVCKRKYQPFRDREKMYGCHLHHAKRKALLDRHGPRDGWESFDQWTVEEGETNCLPSPSQDDSLLCS
ncbi:unnamed protein product, partial [Choristocarpus tenellus]